MTTAAKRKLKLATVAEEPEDKKDKKEKTRGQVMDRGLLMKEDKLKQDTPEIKVVCPMPRASDKKTVLMRKFVHQKCIKHNESGVHQVKWSPEIDLTNRDNASDQKILQAKFKLYMTNDNNKDFLLDEYTLGEFPVKATYSLRKGLEKQGNNSIIEMDHASFALLVHQGRKWCNFVDKNLRGQAFVSIDSMNLPDIISLDSRDTGTGRVHTLLMLSIFKWGTRPGKVQPFFNIRRFFENADGKLAPTTKGVTLNFREMHNLVFSAAEYLNVMSDQFAKPKIVHDKMRDVLGEKVSILKF
jgi:hypothetical protein